MSLRLGYARTSTDRQNNILQIDALKAAGCDRIYSEARSGAARDRPELARLLDSARQGDVIVVYSLSRLSRSVRQLVETVETLEAKGVQLRSLVEALDTSTPSGRLVFHMFAAIGQFERELIAERVRDGLKAAKARGRVGGRKRAMDERAIKTVRALLLAGEMSVSEIARTCKLGVTTIYRNFPAARAGADAGGEWAAPKVCRIPPALAVQPVALERPGTRG